MEAKFPYGPGDVIEFLYPIENTVDDYQKGSQWRLAQVSRVRDLKVEPLDPLTLALWPKRRRCRYLIYCFDFVRNADRKFYFDSMAHLQEAVAEARKLRLAVFDPCEPDDSPEFVGPIFCGNAEDRYVMRLAMDRYNALAKKANHSLCIAPFPWRPAA